jgi:hypothetical protein
VVLRLAPGRGLVEGADAEIAALTELAGRTEEPRLRRMFRALLKEQEDLAWAPDPFAVLEVALVRLASMPAGDEVEALLGRIDALEKRLRGESPEPSGAPGGGGAGSARRGSEPAAPPSRGNDGVRTEASTPPAATTNNSAPATKASAASASAPAPGVRAAQAETPRSEPPRASTPEADEEPPIPDEAPPEAFASFEPAPLPRGNAPAPLAQVFDRLRSFAQDENRGLFAALEGGRLLAKSDDALRIALPSAIAARRLESRKPDLESVCARFFGKLVRVELVADANGAAANAAKTAGDGEHARRRRQDALAHPAVNAALEVLGAEIAEIRPLGGAS